ncbi:MAG: hypothetical protein AABY22_29130 [Nanoarchaeota archaeon]
MEDDWTKSDWFLEWLELAKRDYHQKDPNLFNYLEMEEDERNNREKTED